MKCVCGKVKKIILTVFLLVCTGGAVRGEVYLLGPVLRRSAGGKKISADARQWREITGFTLLKQENMVYNGTELVQDIGIVPYELGALLRRIGEFFPDAKSFRGGDFVRVALPHRKGEKYITVLLIAAVSGGDKCTVFAVERPFPAPANIRWPDDIARFLPPGAVAAEYMYFPERRAFFGEFQTPPQQAASGESMGAVFRNAAAAGFVPAGTPEDSGCIFINHSAGEIMLAGSGSDGNGFLYLRPLKKK